MTCVINHVNELVPNLEWLKDSLVKVWRGRKGWSLQLLSKKILRITLVREVGRFFKHDINLGSLKD